MFKFINIAFREGISDISGFGCLEGTTYIIATMMMRQQK